ncbi:UNVERIFIED_CONTAM: hypothetical protein HDU68_011229 [Siphonaria sp. JEL0065]|nr:hypothetical protein HDU68_011229 [Siphonaria sp. JEL0065]
MDFSVPLTLIDKILSYTDAATVGRAHRSCKLLHSHLNKLRPAESDSIYRTFEGKSRAIYTYEDERAVDRLKTQRYWERITTNGSDFRYKLQPQLAPVEPLNAAILAAMKKSKSGPPKKRVITAVNTTFGYIGATKALHVHLLASASTQSPITITRSSPLLFLQSSQPRNLQITDLLTYARVPIRFTEKKPFVFRILNWTHTPFIYFVDRDDYTRKLWYFDEATKAIIPVVGITHDPPLENPVEAVEDADAAAAAAPVVPTMYSLIDPFAHVVDVDDASVNDNVAGFGNVVVWWTWVGVRRPRNNNNNGDEEEEEEEEEGMELVLEPGQRRPPRRFELKVHAYEVTKEKDIEGAGIQVKVTTLWTHHLYLTSSQNLSAHMTNNRLHILHHKKLKPKNDTEVVAKFSFDLKFGGGLIEDETIYETVREPETETTSEESSSSVPIPPPQQVPPSRRQIIGSRANNQRIYSRFHCLEFHSEYDFFKPDGTPVGESGDDEEADISVTGYSFPALESRLFTGRDASLGNTTGNARDLKYKENPNQGSGGLVLSLVPIVKNIWRPEKRQVSEDGKLLMVAGVEGSRRCLRVVDVSNGDAESGLIHAFYLDDETGSFAPDGRRRKKVGGGAWVVEQNAESPGWSVLFVECG